MAHMIDDSNARDNIAWVGQAPWHGLGQKLTPDADMETWQREAGLDFQVQSAPVLFDLKEHAGPRTFEGREVLYRTDTRAALSVMSSQYRIVQPAQILDFIAQCVRHSGFQMEVAGSLCGGRRVWALARVHEGAPVIGHDHVRPYLLAATSYDGTMSTTFKFSAIRVVCHNTISMAVAAGHPATRRRNGAESDRTRGAVVQAVRVPHSDAPDYAAIRQKLGVVLTAWDTFLVQARLLADTPINEDFTAALLRALLPKPDGKALEDTRAFRKLMALFKGEERSATLPEAKGTAWGLLNDISWWTDHLRGSHDKRLSSAWFGPGEALKNRTFALLMDTLH